MFLVNACSSEDDTQNLGNDLRMSEGEARTTYLR
jgi:hypothetical protein